MISEPFDITEPTPEFVDGYPCLVRLPGGDLFMLFSRRPEKGGMRLGWIAAMRSSDNGRTWSEPDPVIDTQDMVDLDPNVIAWDDEIMAVSTTVPMTHAERVTVSRFIAVGSRDGGRTWSEAREIETPFVYCSGKINPGLRCDDGTLVCPFSRIVNIDQPIHRDGDSWNECGVLISSDNAGTWTPGETLCISEARPDDQPGAINGLDEPALALCGDGSLYMLMRTGFKCLYQARSLDRGRTWSRPEPTPLVSHNAPADICSFEHQHLGRGWLVVYDHSPADRFPLAAAVSLDEGRSWSPPHILTDQGMPSHYPACCQTRSGEIMVVWQQDTAAGRHLQGCLIDPDVVEELARR